MMTRNRIFAAIVTMVAAITFCAIAALPATLPSLPSPLESFDAGMLHVDRYGNTGPSLVLVPGLGCGPWVWAGTILQFSSKYTIYALTLPGFDGHPPTTRSPLFSAFTAEFWKVVASRHIDHPFVVGHSLGGTLAILLAEQHPDRLRAVVALDGLPVFPALAKATPKERQSIATQAAARFRAINASQLLANMQQYMSTVGTSEPSLVAVTATLEAQSDPAAIAAWLEEDLKTDLRGDLPSAQVPLLEVMPYDPSFDGVAPLSLTEAQKQAFYESLLAAAPEASVKPITPSRHFAMLDQPDVWYQQLDAFLSSH